MAWDSHHLSPGCLVPSSEPDSSVLIGSTLDCTGSAAAVMKAGWAEARRWAPDAFLTQVSGAEDSDRGDSCRSGIGEPFVGDGMANEWRLSFEAPSKPGVHLWFDQSLSDLRRPGGLEVPNDEMGSFYMGGPDLSSWKFDTADIAASLLRDNPTWREMAGLNNTAAYWHLYPGPTWSVKLLKTDAGEPCLVAFFDAISGVRQPDDSTDCEERKRGWAQTFGET